MQSHWEPRIQVSKFHKCTHIHGYLILYIILHIVNNYILFISLGLMNFHNPLIGEDDNEAVGTRYVGLDVAAEISCNHAAGI